MSAHDQHFGKITLRPEQKRSLEIRNAAIGADYVAEFYSRYPDRSIYTTSVLFELHNIYIHEIYYCAGRFRDASFDKDIQVSEHRPCPAYQVHPAMVELLEYAGAWRANIPDVQDETNSTVVSDKFSYAAEMFHRLNYIHPFAGGNGRVSRAFLHLMCYDMGILFPPDHLWEQFVANRDRYLECMQQGDHGNILPLQLFLMEGFFKGRIFFGIDGWAQRFATYGLSNEFKERLKSYPHMSPVFDSSIWALPVKETEKFLGTIYEVVEEMIEIIENRRTSEIAVDDQDAPVTL